MKDLFTDFTLAQIVSISIGLLLAIKGATSFVVYFKNLYNEKFGVIIRDYLQRSTIGSGISWEGNDLFCSLHLCDWILIKIQLWGHADDRK